MKAGKSLKPHPLAKPGRGTGYESVALKLCPKRVLPHYHRPFPSPSIPKQALGLKASLTGPGQTLPVLTIMRGAETSGRGLSS